MSLYIGCLDRTCSLQIGMAIVIVSHHLCPFNAMFSANLLMHMCFAVFATEVSPVYFQAESSHSYCNIFCVEDEYKWNTGSADRVNASNVNRFKNIFFDIF